MTKRILIYPYSSKSASAKLLKEALSAQFILKQGSQYVSRYTDVVINWGSGYLPSYPPARVLNKASAVNKAVCKVSTFECCKTAGVPTVPFTTDRAVAQSWLSEGKTVVVRHSISSSGGKGIEILTPSQTAPEAPPAAATFHGYWGGWMFWKAPVASNLAQETPIQQPEVPYAPLYTQLIQKEAEFRVHAAGGKAIHTQMKLRKNGVEASNVWNHDNGYTFTSQCEGRVHPSILDNVREVGVRAVQALGLDFGAVDLAYAGGQGMVLEVNTAPGIEEPTLSKYVDYFRGIQ